MAALELFEEAGTGPYGQGERRRLSHGGVDPEAGCLKHGPVDLLTASNYVILAAAGISTVPQSVIDGDIGETHRA